MNRSTITRVTGNGGYKLGVNALNTNEQSYRDYNDQNSSEGDRRSTRER